MALIEARARDQKINRSVKELIGIPDSLPTIQFLEDFIKYSKIVGMTDSEMLARFPICFDYKFDH